MRVFQAMDRLLASTSRIRFFKPHMSLFLRLPEPSGKEAQMNLSLVLSRKDLGSSPVLTCTSFMEIPIRDLLAELILARHH
jgi:hypothetical protein